MVGGTGAALELMAALGEEWAEGGGASVRVPASLGSAGGLHALRDRVLDVAVIGRELTDEERGWGIVSVELARTPIVFASRRGGDVRVSEIEDAYRGVSPVWPDGAAMVTLGREGSDTALGALSDRYPGLGRALSEGAAVTSYTDQQMLDELVHVDGALGFVDLGALSLSGAEVQPMSLEGNSPASAEYPVWRVLRLAYLGGGAPEPGSFVEFARGRLGEGQWVERGYHAP